MPEAITRSPVTLKCLIVEGFVLPGNSVKVYRVKVGGALEFLWLDSDYFTAQTRARKLAYLEEYDRPQFRILHKRSMKQHYSKRW